MTSSTRTERSVRPRRRSKRFFDLIVAAILLALLWPVMLLIAVAVWLESPGPILFRQVRVGEHEHPFTMLKFRSMIAGAEPELHRAHMARLIQANLGPEQLPSGHDSFKLARDPRVTRVGAFIRRTSLDELPQFFNVLGGQMSMVGPRPPIPYEVLLYQEWHKQRLSALPGITGLWQVHGRNRVSFDDMVRMDIDYIERQSLWLDVKLLLQTPWAALGGRGAG